MHRSLSIFLLILVGFGCSSAFAGILFYDNFNAENGGSYQLNYTGFANWSVSDGTVDLIGVGSPWNWFPSHGLYVDLDGSTSDPGTLLSKSFTLTPGQYAFSFDLAGSQREGYDPNEQVAVSVLGGSLFSDVYTVFPTDPFSTRTIPFTVSSGGTYQISFLNGGRENVGALLDNVTLTQVPEPSLVLLLGLGLGSVCLFVARPK